MKRVWVFIGALVGCGEMNAKPDGAVTSKQHLYVANDDAPGGIACYGLPLVAGAVPDFTIRTEGMFDVAFDAAGNLIGSTNTNKLIVFIQPLSGSSVPTATFPNGTADIAQVVVTPSGNLIVATQSNLLNVFAPPFTNNSAPVSMITASALSWTMGAALDAQANLFVANNAPSSSDGNLLMFPPPYQAASAITQPVIGTKYRNIVLSGTQLYVASASNAASVDVYDLPLTNASMPSFSIVTGTNLPEGIAIDNEGHLYVGNLGDQTVVRYSPPFSASSVPDVKVIIPGFTIFGIGIGP